MSAILAVNLAEDGGLLVRVLASVVNQTADSLADVRQLVGLCHRLQELDFFKFQRDLVFDFFFHP